MDDSLNICLACGLCCDGTLIGFVELKPEEISEVKKVMDIEEVNGNGFFLHPCDKFCDGCTIYLNRPKNCDHFKCELLHAVEKKELEFDSAVKVIESVKKHKLSIEKKVALLPFSLKSPSFYYKMVELKKRLLKNEATSSITDNQLALIADLKRLDSLLLTNFGITLD